MQGKKNQNQNNSELPTHLDMTVRERFNLLNLWSVEVFWHQRNDFLESSVHGTRPQDADNGKQQPREVILLKSAIFDLIESNSKEVHGVAGEGLPALRDGEAVLGRAAAATHQGG